MSKTPVHTSPDLFDPDKVNVFDPNSAEMIGQIHHTSDGNVTSSTRSGQLSMFNGDSESYGFLAGTRRKRVKKYVHPWDARMKVYHQKHDKY